MIASASLTPIGALVDPVLEPWDKTSIDMQVRAYDDWRKAHTRWHDLFPATLPVVQVR